MENYYYFKIIIIMDMQTNKKLEIKEVLDNILLPLDASWGISSVRTDDESGKIFLQREFILIMLLFL